MKIEKILRLSKDLRKLQSCLNAKGISFKSSSGLRSLSAEILGFRDGQYEWERIHVEFLFLLQKHIDWLKQTKESTFHEYSTTMQILGFFRSWKNLRKKGLPGMTTFDGIQYFTPSADDLENNSKEFYIQRLTLAKNEAAANKKYWIEYNTVSDFVKPHYRMLKTCLTIPK